MPEVVEGCLVVITVHLAQEVPQDMQGDVEGLQQRQRLEHVLQKHQHLRVIEPRCVKTGLQKTGSYCWVHFNVPENIQNRNVYYSALDTVLWSHLHRLQRDWSIAMEF